MPAQPSAPQRHGPPVLLVHGFATSFDSTWRHNGWVDLLQDAGHNTYQANTALGLPEDSRDFSDAAIALRYLLGGRALRLLSNNPDKRRQLEENGQPVSECVSLIAGVCEHNLRYMRAKRAKGHMMPEDL